MQIAAGCCLACENRYASTAEDKPMVEPVSACIAPEQATGMIATIKVGMPATFSVARKARMTLRRGGFYSTFNLGRTGGEQGRERTA
jgi:hypothetical protein